MGSVVALESDDGPLKDEILEKIQKTRLGKDLAMHVAAMKPQCIDGASVDKEQLAKETELLRKQASETTNREEIVDIIVKGRLQKFYETVCLLQQKYVKEEDVTIADYLRFYQKFHKLEQPIKIGGFIRLQCGEDLKS